jgi:acyl-CoA dehydrogenase
MTSTVAPHAAPVLDAGPRPTRAELVALVHTIGAGAAAPAADAVDRDARFPHEAFAALREARLLGALVPTALGGLGRSIGDVAAMCEALGHHCANAAMVFAMHQIQVACLVHHGLDTPYIRDYLATLAARQLLLASATTETNVGGDVRTSLCAVERDGARFTLQKSAPVISYGVEADDILVTARRAPDAASSDQVIVIARKAETTLEQISGWDTLGFRGTCSSGFALRTSGDAEQVLPQPYAEISARTMHPVSHILWSSLWLGMATDAVARARAFVRAEARKKPGTTPPGAMRLAALSATLQTMRADVHNLLGEYEALLAQADATPGMAFTIRANNLKLSSSTLVVRVVSEAMLVTGIAGYRLDGDYALGRHLRDAHGAALMINNDRIAGANAALLLVSKED